MKIEGNYLVSEWSDGENIKTQRYHFDDIELIGEPYDDSERIVALGGEPRPSHGWTFNIIRNEKTLAENNVKTRWTAEDLTDWVKSGLMESEFPKIGELIHPNIAECIMMPYSPNNEPNKEADVRDCWNAINEYKVAVT